MAQVFRELVVTSDLLRVIMLRPLVTYLALSPPAAALATIMPLSLSLKGTILPLNTKFYHKKIHSH